MFTRLSGRRRVEEIFCENLFFFAIQLAVRLNSCLLFPLSNGPVPVRAVLPRHRNIYPRSNKENGESFAERTIVRFEKIDKSCEELIASLAVVEGVWS